MSAEETLHNTMQFSSGNQLDGLQKHFVLLAMKEYAFEAWMAGEENGRNRLSQKGKLDKEGSKRDFERIFINNKKPK